MGQHFDNLIIGLCYYDSTAKMAYTFIILLLRREESNVLEATRMRDDLGIVCNRLGISFDDLNARRVAMMTEVMTHRYGMVTFDEVPAEVIYAEYSKEYAGIDEIDSMLQFAFTYCLAPEVFFWLLRQNTWTPYN